MEKKVYELKTSEALEHVMPPLQKEELELLTGSLLAEGCRDPLVVWNGVLVDGHNRYRICVSNHIPFTYVQMDFANQTEAMLWIVKNHIGRRNLSPFQKCEMVLPLETELKAEAKRHQGWRSDIHGQKAVSVDTRDVLANMAGVSHGTVEKVKVILNTADDETLRRVRKGEISIHFAYSSLIAKPSKSERLEPSMDAIRQRGTPSLDLIPIADTVHELINRVIEGEATTKMIITELENVAQMIDQIGR